MPAMKQTTLYALIGFALGTFFGQMVLGLITGVAGKGGKGKRHAAPQG